MPAELVPTRLALGGRDEMFGQGPVSVPVRAAVGVEPSPSAHPPVLACGTARRSGAGTPDRQDDLAERLGRPQGFVSKVESGERRIDLVELHRHCDAVGVSLLAVVRRYLEAVVSWHSWGSGRG